MRAGVSLEEARTTGLLDRAAAIVALRDEIEDLVSPAEPQSAPPRTTTTLCSRSPLISRRRTTNSSVLAKRTKASAPPCRR